MEDIFSWLFDHLLGALIGLAVWFIFLFCLWLLRSFIADTIASGVREGIERARVEEYLKNIDHRLENIEETMRDIISNNNDNIVGELQNIVQVLEYIQNDISDVKLKNELVNA